MKIRAFALALALLGGLALGGCSTTADPNGGPPVVTGPNYTEIIAQVQAACATACKFVPTAGTIVSILTAGNPGVVSGVAIASAICAALAPPPAASSLVRRTYRGRTVAGVVVNGWVASPRFRGSASVPMVNGVEIKGRYIN